MDSLPPLNRRKPEPASEDAADPDFEVINAIRPGMATIPNAMLLCASSPHARKGALWNAYHRHVRSRINISLRFPTTWQ
jgi:hypothetical protein